VTTFALLHGFAGAPEAWDDVIVAWPDPRPPVAIALPGHGSADVRATWEANLDVVAERVRAAGAQIVVGYSLGARLALGLVARDPELRAILISVNPGIGDDERAARRAQDAAWATRLRVDGIDAFLAAWQAQPLFASQARVAEEIRARRSTWRSRLEPEQLARALEVMGLAEMPDYRATLASLAPRVLLVVGREDAKFLAIARAHAAVACIELQGCGHDPTLERPRDLAEAIARPLREYSA
jgi:2-succinyl-6-hydroxy-2,4-cyclohexadiene-1-carboxylate synthase